LFGANYSRRKISSYCEAKANPMLVGPLLEDFYEGRCSGDEGEDSPIYLAPICLDWCGEYAGGRQVSDLGLKDYDYDSEKCEVKIKNTCITLNIWEFIKVDKATAVTDVRGKLLRSSPDC
jgi:hypothetical protein